MPASWRIINRKKVLYLDFEGITDENEMIETSNQAEYLVRQHFNHELLILVNFLDSNIGSKFFAQARLNGKHILAEKECKTAIFGMNSLQRLLLCDYKNVTNSQAVFFDSKSKAESFLGCSVKEVPFCKIATPLCSVELQKSKLARTYSQCNCPFSRKSNCSDDGILHYRKSIAR